MEAYSTVWWTTIQVATLHVFRATVSIKLTGYLKQAVVYLILVLVNRETKRNGAKKIKKKEKETEATPTLIANLSARLDRWSSYIRLIQLLQLFGSFLCID